MYMGFNWYYLFTWILIPSSRVLSDEEDYYKTLSRTGVLEAHPMTKYIASIKYLNHETSYAENHLCAGIVITSQAIVTVAHCLLDKNFTEIDPGQLVIMYGFTMGSIYDDGLQKRTARRTTLHKNFDPKTLANDIAIVNLREPFFLNENTLTSARIASTSLSPYKQCSILGFGVLFFKDTKLTQLLEQSLQVWPSEACTEYVRNYGYNENDKFCAGDFKGSEAPCVGLASEPMICNDVAYGMSLFNIGCDTSKGFAVVFIDFSQHNDWLSEQSGELVLFGKASHCHEAGITGAALEILFSVLIFEI